MASVPSTLWSGQGVPVPRKGRIKQSVSRWCYQQIPLDELCAKSAQMGLKAVDLLNPEEYEVPGAMAWFAAWATREAVRLTAR